MVTSSPCGDDWLDAAFSFPSLQDRKVLILGLGGGCDIIAAYAISQLSLESRPVKSVYANTKKKNDGTLEMITPHIGRISSEPLPAGKPRGQTYGTTLIDRGVPQGDEGCPWIFLISDGKAEEQLPGEIREQGFDVILGVDIGGDSLVPAASSGERGRDKRMLRVLEETGLPLFHLVVAPGADGESSFEELVRTFNAPANRNRYRGNIKLDPVLELLRSLSASLTPQRTPRIILDAAEDRLEQTPDGRVVVPRGRKPSVPRDWLLRAFVFTGREPRGRQGELGEIPLSGGDAAVVRGGRSRT